MTTPIVCSLDNAQSAGRITSITALNREGLRARVRTGRQLVLTCTPQMRPQLHDTELHVSGLIDGYQ